MSTLVLRSKIRTHGERVERCQACLLLYVIPERNSLEIKKGSQKKHLYIERGNPVTSLPLISCCEILVARKYNMISWEGLLS
jgi:hypothetical protein